jgi:hypothetical protein
MLSLYDIPQEILVSILTEFRTKELLPLVIVSQRFHSIILRILHFRLLLAAALPEYKIILEAFHPARRHTEPYLFCSYLGTDGLSSKHEGEGSLYEDCEGAAGRLGKLGQLYSRFRPESPGVEGTMPLRRIAGATPVQASGSSTQPIYRNEGDGGTKKITHNLNIDSDELFTQFCAYASLVRLGPRRGVFLSTVHLVQTGEGVMRVWREWLEERAAETKNWDDEKEAALERTPTDTPPSIANEKSIIWTNSRRNTGLRVTVRDVQRRFTSGSDGPSDDLPLSFVVEIKG